MSSVSQGIDGSSKKLCKGTKETSYAQSCQLGILYLLAKMMNGKGLVSFTFLVLFFFIFHP